MRYPQGPPYIENTKENTTRSFGNGCERRVHPCFTDQLLEKQFLKTKGQGTPWARRVAGCIPAPAQSFRAHCLWWVPAPFTQRSSPFPHASTSHFTANQTGEKLLSVLLRKASANTQCQESSSLGAALVTRTCTWESHPTEGWEAGKHSPESTHQFHLPLLEIVRNNFSNPCTNLPQKKRQCKNKKLWWYGTVFPYILNWRRKMLYMEQLISEIRPEMDLTVNRGNTRTGCLKNLMFIWIFTVNLRGINPQLDS